MQTEPRINIVVFEVKRLLKKETFIEETPSQSDHAIQTAWQSLQTKATINPSQIRQIYSEWEPSDTDKEFIVQTFSRAKVSYSFPRPAPDGWEEAFEEARRTILQASVQKQVSNNIETVLFPVLRDYEPDDVFAQMIVHRSIGNEFAIYLAHLSHKPEGSIGLQYLMSNSIEANQETYFETAYDNLRKDLKVEGRQSEGAILLSVSHPSNMAASAVGLPDFYSRFAEWVGQTELFVAYTDPNSLYVTVPGSAFADTLIQGVRESDYWGAVALTPACYHWNAEGVKQIAARAKST